MEGFKQHISTTPSLAVVEVENATADAGDLFQRAFGDNIPDFPKHFLFQFTDQQEQKHTLGYVHFTRHHQVYLGGGMCIDTQVLRRLPKNARNQLNQQGGPAFSMLSAAVKQLHDCVAVFGYVGHQGAYKIDLAVGFEPTEYPHLIVYWQQELTAEEQQEITQQVAKIGPF